ncbi:fimbrial biogenesis chaperone [Bordetella hinzii]|uniref:Molecular chaperone n=1 Tax=Bordetella hinzii TaxID=103855 RepID=A0AAN1S144_9BORD|nr:fimbria/pilus periplasmic chaperone [Bordetella hinzii]AKQ60010.1 Chaperone protein EcpD precursor [Bordetella hinzii]AZW19674.1 molecular chaperone [Bordetella hinzii]MBZ0073293.1 fimbria/pilus periplasmic chaperone [Bordetella hinzii]MBZ0078231.1 fimbria/pilus periplasmic chaperone [Bordetella hinzii]MBZ0082090.1 fimbria/pilus periplasmic chaperone [Bordetella hinzii]
MNISTQRVMRSAGDVLPAVTFWRRIMMRACAAALGLAVSTVAQASLVIEGTRVVYKAGAPEVVVKMTNDGNTASLMQAWIDDGRAEATPDEMNVPFFLTPPLARVEPGKGQALRIFHTEGGKALPQDRESLFWLNVLDVPPKAEGAEDAGAILQISVRSRLKLFYRPKGLAGSAETAPASLEFKVGANGKLAVANPTPYYVNLRELAFGPEKQPTRSYPALMIAPFGSETLDLGGSTPRQIRYAAISDLGSIHFFEREVGRH